MAHIGDDRRCATRFIAGARRRCGEEGPGVAAIRAAAFRRIGRLLAKRVAINQGGAVTVENGEVFTAGAQLKTNVVGSLIRVVVGIEKQITVGRNQ